MLATEALPLKFLSADDIVHLTTGAAVLGCGGGGDPYIGGLITQRAIIEHGPVHVTQVQDLPDDALVIPVAGVGAPTVSVEKLDDIEYLPRIVECSPPTTGVVRLT